MSRTITVKFVDNPGYPKRTFYKYRPIITSSTHPKYKVGTRFDYGFMHIAIAEGYDVHLLGSTWNNNSLEENEDCLFTGLLGKTKCTSELRNRYPKVCGNCGHNPESSIKPDT